VDGDRILLAVSGGGDSMGMVALFLSALPRPDLELAVAHVHHNLRQQEADRDMEAVEKLAEKLHLPFVPLRLKGDPASGESVEEWARIGRYAALESAAEEGEWTWIATGHTIDDQAETLLMRIHRGSGMDGLAGILPRSGRVLRPVLNFTGDELREAAVAAGFRWLEDSTNRDARYLRNRIRMEVLPVLDKHLPGFSRRLAALARLASEAPGAFDPTRFVALHGDSLYYNCEGLAGLSDGEGTEVFRVGLRLQRGTLRRITERHLRALWSLRTARPGAIVSLPGGWVGIRGKEGIEVKRPPDGTKGDGR